MAEPEDFKAPDGFDEAAITEFRNMARDFAAAIADDLQDAGFTTRQGASMAAHIMLDAAWAVATCGALAESVEPQPERFIEAAHRAIGRLDMEATKARFAAMVEDDDLEPLAQASAHYRNMDAGDCNG